MRPLHESVAKEKPDEISLIEAKNEANNTLLAKFSTKSSRISAICTSRMTSKKVSNILASSCNPLLADNQSFFADDLIQTHSILQASV